MDLAGRQLRGAERCTAALGREGESLAIHVIPVRDLIPHLDLAGTFCRAEFERDGRVKEVVGRTGGARRAKQHE